MVTYDNKRKIESDIFTYFFEMANVPRKNV